MPHFDQTTAQRCLRTLHRSDKRTFASKPQHGPCQQIDELDSGVTGEVEGGPPRLMHAKSTRYRRIQKMH
jgi:hypothetical protein